jgi:hypothetical protein
MILPPYEQIEYVTIFAVDVMFFQSAKTALAKARAAVKGLDRAERRLAKHMHKLEMAREHMDDVDHRGNSPRGSYEEFESLAISAESYEYTVTEEHGPIVQQLALVHILSATSLEAHINIRADTLLAGRSWKAFEGLNVAAKWLFLPKIAGLKGFDPGAEPFQGFEKLVRARNALVHYKPRKERYEGYDDPAGFAARLDLTFEDCERSLATVQGMVTELAKQLGEKTPRWFDSDSTHFFQVQKKGGRMTRRRLERSW